MAAVVGKPSNHLYPNDSTRMVEATELVTRGFETAKSDESALQVWRRLTFLSAQIIVCVNKCLQLILWTMKPQVNYQELRRLVMHVWSNDTYDL